MKSLNLRSKPILRTAVPGLLVIFFFVGIVFGYYHMLYEEKRSNIIKDGRIAARQSANEFEGYLSTNIDLIDFSAYTLDEMIREKKSNPEIQAFLVGQSTAVRNAVLENSTGLYGYINGRFFSGTNWEPPADYDATLRPWYTKPLENPGMLTILEPYVDVQSGNTMLALGKSLCDGVSVVSVDVSLDQMQSLTELAVTEGGSDIEMILTADGTVVTHSDINEVGKNYGQESGSLGSEVYGRLSDEKENYYEFDHDFEHYIVYDAKILDDWYCISVHNSTSVFTSLNQIFVVTVFIIIAMVLILGIILTVSAKRGYAASEAIAANEARARFLSNMSHEIRTPINAVLGMNEMILRESRESNVRGYSARIKRSGEELLRLVNELLDFSRSESGTAETSVRKPFTAPSAWILAIDDNEMNIEVLKSLLKRTKINIDTAHSGDEGIRMCLRRKYDLILLDYMMPGKDGIETLHEMRRKKESPNASTPVVCLTANVEEGARKRYMAEGFDDYMTKPLDPCKLEEMLLRYLPEDKIVTLLPGEDNISVDGQDTEVHNENDTSDPLNALASSGCVDVERGVRNSGSINAYMSLLNIFYSSIDEKSSELESLLENGDIRNYTIKVHALKSSLRIIGASALGNEAQALENAGKNNDTEYIRSHHEAWIREYRSLSEPLSAIFDKDKDVRSTKPVAENELMSEALKELRSAADDMDCDRLTTILNEMDDYRIPDQMISIWNDITTAVQNYNYSHIIRLIDQYDTDVGSGR